MKKENIIDDNDLMKVSGGKTRPGKTPPTYTDYMPDDYTINGYTLGEAISALNEMAITGMGSAVQFANGALFPHEGWRHFYSEGIEIVTERMFNYPYYRELQYSISKKNLRKNNWKSSWWEKKYMHMKCFDPIINRSMCRQAKSTDPLMSTLVKYPAVVYYHLIH